MGYSQKNSAELLSHLFSGKVTCCVLCQAHRGLTVANLDFFCYGIQLYVLSSPYLCFISFLYLNLYVLGDDASTVELKWLEQAWDHKNSSSQRSF